MPWNTADWPTATPASSTWCTAPANTIVEPSTGRWPRLSTASLAGSSPVVSASLANSPNSDAGVDASGAGTA